MIERLRSQAGVALLLTALAIVRSLPAAEADWLRWRGPNGNGISVETGWNPKALSSAPKIVWKVKIGAGYSSVAVKGKRVYTMGHEKPNDVVYCLDIADGKEVWTFKYPAKPPQYPGPRAMPVLDGDTVYTFGAEGQVHGLDAEKGQKKWFCDVTREHQAKPPTWGHSASPLIDGDWLILNAGLHGLVLDKKTGAKVWSSGPGVGGYAAPVLYKGGPEKRLAIFGQKGIYGVDFKTGKKLWFHPWETSYDVLAADPIVANKQVFISSGYGKGCALLDISGVQPKVVWQNTAMRNHFSSCVLLDGFVYGVDGNAGGGALKCLDWKTGAEKWKKDTGFGGMMVADKKILLLNEQGKLFIAEAKPDGYTELSSGPVHAPTCWTAPVLCRGLVFCRNQTSELVCVDLRK